MKGPFRFNKSVRVEVRPTKVTGDVRTCCAARR